MTLLGQRPGTADDGTVDFLQSGVTKSADWLFTATINSATGVLGSAAATGGVCWCPDPVSGLVRSVTASTALSGVVPPSLPVAGKYMNVAVQVAPGAFGAAASVSAICGVEQSSEAAAKINRPAPVASKVRIRELVVRNVAGVYSIVYQKDVRPWAASATPWEPLALDAKVEAQNPESEPWVYNPPAVRLEQRGAVARLRGMLTVRASQSVVAGDIIATLPFPIGTSVHPTFTAFPGGVMIAESQLQWQGEAVIAGRHIFLDGVTVSNS